MNVNRGKMKNLKVGVIVREPYIFKHEIVDGGKKTYTFSGFLFKIWQMIADANNYECTYTYIGDIYYTKLLKEGQGKYDVIIGNISELPKRFEFFNFTKLVKLNPISLIVSNSKGRFTFLKTFIMNLIKPLIVLVLVGIILGLGLDFANKGRRLIPEHEPKRSILRPILSAIASMFGEMGFVTERASLTPLSITMIMITIVISYYSSIYLQASTVGDIIDYKRQSIIKDKPISTLRLFSLKGNAIAKNFFEKLGAKVDYFESSEVDKFLEKYKKNINKYDGLIFDYDTAVDITTKESDLIIDPNVFGYDKIVFGIAKNNPQLHAEINTRLISLHENLDIFSICSSHKNVNPELCAV